MPEIAEFSILKVRLRSPMENFKEKARQKLFCVRGFFDIFIYDGKLSIFTDRFHIFLKSLLITKDNNLVKDTPLRPKVNPKTPPTSLIKLCKS